MLEDLRNTLIERYKEYYTSYLELSGVHTEGKGILAGHLQEIPYILHIAYNMKDYDIARIELAIRRKEK